MRDCTFDDLSMIRKVMKRKVLTFSHYANFPLDFDKLLSWSEESEEKRLTCQ